MNNICACEWKDGKVSSMCAAHEEFVRKYRTPPQPENLHRMIAAGWKLRVVSDLGKFRASIYLRHTLDAHNHIGDSIDGAIRLLNHYVETDRARAFERSIGYPPRRGTSP